MSQPSFWDQRYLQDVYAYGTAPNAFFRKQLDELPPGRALFPAEGEGRNAVYAASRGWEVEAFDFSAAGRAKALNLAEQAGVSIDYRLADANSVALPEGTYDLVALIYAHLPSAERSALHQSCWKALRPGGHIVLEAFSKDQLGRTSGGPGNPDLLLSESDIDHDFSSAEILILQLEEVQLEEGPYHRGEASVIRFFARKH